MTAKVIIVSKFVVKIETIKSEYARVYEWLIEKSLNYQSRSILTRQKFGLLIYLCIYFNGNEILLKVSKKLILIMFGMI